MILKINGKIHFYTEVSFVDAWNLTTKSIFGFSKTEVLEPVKNMFSQRENILLVDPLHYLLWEIYLISKKHHTSFWRSITWSLIKVE